MDLISSIHTNLHLNDNHAPVDRLTSEVLHAALDHTAPWDFIVEHGLTPETLEGCPASIPENWWYES